MRYLGFSDLGLPRLNAGDLGRGRVDGGRRFFDLVRGSGLGRGRIRLIDLGRDLHVVDGDKYQATGEAGLTFDDGLVGSPLGEEQVQELFPRSGPEQSCRPGQARHKG